MNSITSLQTTSYNMNQPTFKANPVKKPSTFISLASRAAIGTKKAQGVYESFTDIVAKKIVAPVMNAKLTNKLADKTVNVKNMTDIMTTTGSFVTTATYAGATLNNKNLERKPARTLALNQLLVTTLSTIGAFTINNGIADFTKKMSYKFSDANQWLPTKVLNKRVEGFKIAQKLLTFALMYRYVAPVLVTPIASKIGKALNSNDKCSKKVSAKPVEVKAQKPIMTVSKAPNTTAKKIPMMTVSKQSA